VEGAARRSDTKAQLVLELNGLRIAVACESASAVGGDFYVLDPLPDGRTAVVIGDVCGRGAAAARWMARLLPELRQLLALHRSEPAKLLTTLDRAASRFLPDDVFATALCAVIDPAWREICVANAGHVPLLVKRATSRCEIVARASGPPLGLLPGSIYREERVRLASRDVLLMMTDGILEAVEDDLETLSHLLSWLARAPARAEQIGEQLLQRVVQSAGRREDDMTLLSIEFQGLGRAHTPLLVEAG
jgi:serine phosphatase RsbU (regulator of sigma subunit)